MFEVSSPIYTSLGLLCKECVKYIGLTYLKTPDTGVTIALIYLNELITNEVKSIIVNMPQL